MCYRALKGDAEPCPKRPVWFGPHLKPLVERDSTKITPPHPGKNGPNFWWILGQNEGVNLSGLDELFFPSPTFFSSSIEYKYSSCLQASIVRTLLYTLPERKKRQGKKWERKKEKRKDKKKGKIKYWKREKKQDFKKGKKERKKEQRNKKRKKHEKKESRKEKKERRKTTQQ